MAMETETPLDIAHRAMIQDEDAAPRRLRFYARLADSELFMLLMREPEGESLDPVLEDIDTHPYVLVFDREDRLAEFTAAPAPYAALSGRLIAQILAGQGVGIALNLGVAPSGHLIPAAAVDWLAQTLRHAPERLEARPTRLEAPHDLPKALLEGLDAKLASAAGLATHVYLAAVTYEEGRKGHILAIIGAKPAAETALAQAVNEALTFSGLEAGALDVVFLSAEAPITARLARVGLRFDLPQPETPKSGLSRPGLSQTGPKAPGRDPDSPPILR